MPLSLSLPVKSVTNLSQDANGSRNTRRMRSGTLWDQPPPLTHFFKRNETQYVHLATDDVLVNAPCRTTASAAGLQSNAAHRTWDPVDGKITIKVSVPITDDIWRFKVPEDVSFAALHQKVEAKVGFPVVLGTSEQDMTISLLEEAQFQAWVARRVQNGRNTPLTAHPAWMDVNQPL